MAAPATGALVALAMIGGASTAAADDLRFQLQGSVQAGYTDNVAQAPDEQVLPDDPERDADGFLILSPTVAMLIEDAKVLHTFAYGFGATLYFTHSEANSYSHGVSYVSRWNLTPATDLALGLSGAYTSTAAFNLLGGADQTTVGLLPGGEAVEVISVAVTEGIEHAIDDNWSVNQTASAVGLFTLGQVQRNFLFSASGGLERGFEYHTLGASLSGEVLWTPTVEDDAGNEIRGNQTLIARLAGTWSYRLNDYWTSNVAAGGLMATQLGEARNEEGEVVDATPIVQPYGLASIDFADELGNAGLSVEHNVSPNVLTGSVQMTDTATLRVGVPLGRDTGFAVTSTGALGLARVLDVDGTFGPRLVLIVADAGLAYAPPPVPYLSFDLRYQFTKQNLLNPDDAEDLDPQDGLRESHRHTALFGITVTYPPLREEPGAEGAVFRPTPTAGGDILSGVRDARDATERAEEIQEKRERSRGQGGGRKDNDGQYAPIGDDENEDR